MTLVARYATEVGGHIYAKGDRLDWSGAVPARIAANFRREDGSAVEPTKTDDGSARKGTPERRTATVPTPADVVARTIGSLKRDGICRELDGMGITYSPKSSTEYLARLLLVNRGEMKE